MRIVITGASGLLGSAVYSTFKSAQGFDVVGLANSRASGELKKLDLLDKEAVESFFNENKPDWVIHCAAERRPDVAEKDENTTTKINAELPTRLAQLALSLGFTLIYVSTDYVFDGTAPPYAPSAPTCPVNIYGRTKRDGEQGVLGVFKANTGTGKGNAVVLRVPVLYGPAPKNSDSAVNILLDTVQDQSGKKYTMDHYATRYPTNVLDIAKFLTRAAAASSPPISLPSIAHFSAPEPFTKYEMCLVFAKILKVPHEHIVPDAEPPKLVGAGTIRPRDTKLETSETERVVSELKLEGGLGCGLFEEWWTERLAAGSSA